jgi:hypothetical protein|tara:strand:- start:1236 stop:1355 length:120 start_codon:yes stop_codon:yes gene_type:complete
MLFFECMGLGDQLFQTAAFLKYGSKKEKVIILPNENVIF